MREGEGEGKEEGGGEEMVPRSGKGCSCCEGLIHGVRHGRVIGCSGNVEVAPVDPHSISRLEKGREEKENIN